MSDQCSGPFTDARDCPMHAKDVPTPLYTQAQMDAEVQWSVKPLREALEAIAALNYDPRDDAEVRSEIRALAASALGRERK